MPIIQYLVYNMSILSKKMKLSISVYLEYLEVWVFNYNMGLKYKLTSSKWYNLIKKEFD